LEKKMKKTFAALTLATILMFGSTLSFAGIIISDAANQGNTCTENGGIIIFSLDGIIIFSIATSSGEGCPSNTGIIISD
jgi:hypothetical protein